jgi:hypothetical protein
MHARKSIEKIKVHILNFWSCVSSHIEIVLEQPGKKFYKINAWSDPQSEAIINEKDCLKSIAGASESHIVEIEADIKDIISKWAKKYNEEREDFGCCINNCADASAWFLEEFAGIQKPTACGAPFTFNFLCCGLFAPSFLQCCTLPGRVFDVAKRSSEPEEAYMHEMTSLLRLQQ